MLAQCTKPISSTLRQSLDHIEPRLKVHASGKWLRVSGSGLDHQM
jgi:hypothetical protein